ncbi:hypothetical protein, partial [Streptomyces sp. NPDC013489]|uniref:hypothetical protein n=1 Tax=Streptomyces sp. NPDC013489 TaxID=3155606 RepID=UPI0033EC7532
GSLLEADRIGRDGLAEPLTPGALLAEERRLFDARPRASRARVNTGSRRTGAGVPGTRPLSSVEPGLRTRQVS